MNVERHRTRSDEASEDLAAALLTSEGIENPYPLYRRIRASSPVYWSRSMDAWVVTGYREVREVYRDHERFSNAKKHTRFLEALPPETRAQVPTLEMVEATPALALADPPTHTRQRALLMPALTPRRLARKREWIGQLCQDLADSMAKETSPDLIKHFSTPLSYKSILGLFGAPPDHVSTYEEATKAFIAFIDIAGSGVEAALRHERATAALRDSIESVYPALRGHDNGTIISALLNPEDPTKGLERNEMFAILKLFFNGGQENIVYSIPTAIHELLRNPDQLAKVKEDPTLSAGAYEEAVRFDVPVQYNPRNAAMDTELAGLKIRAGDRLLNFKGAANRDPAVWTNPDTFDIGRDQDEPEGGSVTFGQGIHFCAGAGVARLEGSVALATLIRRFPNMRLPDGWRARWENVPASRKLTELPLVLEG